MSAQEWADQALQSFESVVQASAGFRVREGQHLMARQVAETFARAQLGKPEDDVDEPERAIAVIQAGTGVGKSLAYSVPAIAMALARGTRVLISTATVALQEQLVHKDLPQLAARMEQPFAFALAKGRGRYVCKLKLERLAGGGSGGGDDDLPDDDLFPDEAAQARHPRHDAEARLRFYASLADALAQGGWDGDRDSLDTPPEPEVWSPVAAEASSCTGRHCPLFNQCSYFERRKQLVAAQVIVANHDLLLSSIGARLLPELDNCLLVIDEAHHLPATALDQFACEMDLSRLTWLDKLASRALRIGQLVEVEEIADIPNHTARLRAALQDLARLVMDVYGEQLRAPLPGRRSFNSSMPTRARVSGGLLPDALVGPLGQAAHHADGFLQALSAIAKALKSEMRDKPDEARRLSQLYAQIGSLAPRLEGVHACAQLLLQDAPEGAVPAAKWFTLQVEGDFIVVRAHASPVLPGNTLKNHLWSAVRGAVLTSATLTSCGQFDFFLRESGLHGDAAVTTLAVASPFDYARQGLLVATETQAEPRDAQT
ncbi:MAG: ATP-dependent DNA helicase DinG, partial [Alicycliphilus sp.]|nr:ATP-dependent DNA helicase DinG [Alicycliphilus sp.]